MHFPRAPRVGRGCISAWGHSQVGGQARDATGSRVAPPSSLFPSHQTALQPPGSSAHYKRPSEVVPLVSMGTVNGGWNKGS